MANLLPQNEQRTLTREYRLRVTALALFVTAIVFATGAVLLVPSVIAIYARERVLSGRVAFARDVRQRQGDEPLAPSLAGANAILSTLDADIESTVATTDLVVKIVALAGDDILVDSVVFDRRDSSWHIELAGIARTREALIALERRIEAHPGVAGATVPLEQFAKERDIMFSIVITGATKTPNNS